MKSSSTKILVVTHKPYQFPDDSGYLPVFAGNALAPNAFNLQGDDQGENISSKNKRYCELTALYWAWKNLDSDFVGLVHYRRYFKGEKGGSIPLLQKKISSSKHLESILLNGAADIILARKRNYFIESIESHYKNAHHPEDLDILKRIIAEKYPDYLEDLNAVLGSTSASMFNMLVTHKNLLDSYSSWLFEVLEKVEAEINFKQRSEFQMRALGFLAEILLNVWVKHENLRVKELPIVHLEGENLIKKGANLIARKLISEKKYDS